MDIMEQLLCPQVCMDVEETPLELNNSVAPDNVNDNDSDDCDNIPEDVKIKLLLEVENFDPCQTPEKLTPEEEIVKTGIFETGPMVQFLKLHCTACNVHLGSAPINQFNRYIHPVLQVLLCKSCYDFYTSGDFEKDEDGSELYCRWCGQGGKVMCCSKCCFVFCQKCTRHNLGKKVLDVVKNSDDWVCFACDPKQLVHLKVICTTLFEFIQDLIKEAKKTMDFNLLKQDSSLCCRNQKSYRPLKRKRSNSDDSNFDPNKYLACNIKEEPKKKTSILSTVLTSICKPPNSVPSKVPPLVPYPAWTPRSQVSTQNSVRPTQIPASNPPTQNFVRLKLIGPKVTPVLKSPIVLSASTTRPVTTSSLHNQAAVIRPELPQNYKKPANPIRVIPTTQLQNIPVKNGPVNQNNTINLQPGLKHDWFENAAKNTKSITNNLNHRIAVITSEQQSVTTIEELAMTHNKLQEVISSSVNLLIQVRKTLRTEFLNNLDKLKFQNTNNKPIIISHTNSRKDDDVVLVNNLEDPLKIVTTSSLIENKSPRTYLKVKPVTSLLDENHLKIHQMLGHNEPIDLCDDDDEETAPVIKEAPVINSGNNKVNMDTPQIEADCDVVYVPNEPISSNLNEASTADLSKVQDQITSPNQKKDNNDESTINNSPIRKEPDLDSETYRQIQRALAESKFESIVAENSTIKVAVPNLTEDEIKRMLTVRIVLHPKHRLKQKNLTSKRINAKTNIEHIKKVEEEIIPQDFEEMLSGSIVINTTKQKFGDIFSNFIIKSKSTNIESKNFPVNDTSDHCIHFNKNSDNSINSTKDNAFNCEKNNINFANSMNVSNEQEHPELSVTEESVQSLKSFANLEKENNCITSSNIENRKGTDINEDSCFFSEDGTDTAASREASESKAENLNDQVGTRDSGIDIDTK